MEEKLFTVHVSYSINLEVLHSSQSCCQPITLSFVMGLSLILKITFQSKLSIHDRGVEQCSTLSKLTWPRLPFTRLLDQSLFMPNEVPQSEQGTVWRMMKSKSMFFMLFNTKIYTQIRNILKPGAFYILRTYTFLAQGIWG